MHCQYVASTCEIYLCNFSMLLIYMNTKSRLDMSCRCNYNCRVWWHQVLEGPTYFNPLLAQHTIGRTYNGEHPHSIASAHTIGTTTGGITSMPLQHTISTCITLALANHWHETLLARHNILLAQQGISITYYRQIALSAQHTIGTTYYQHNILSTQHTINTTYYQHNILSAQQTIGRS